MKTPATPAKSDKEILLDLESEIIDIDIAIDLLFELVGDKLIRVGGATFNDAEARRAYYMLSRIRRHATLMLEIFHDDAEAA